MPYFAPAQPLSPARTTWITLRERTVLLENADGGQQLSLDGEEIMALWVAWCWRPVQASGSPQEASAPPGLFLGESPRPLDTMGGHLEALKALSRKELLA